MTGMAEESRSARRPLLWIAVRTIAVMVGWYLLVGLFERLILGLLSDVAAAAMDAQLALEKMQYVGICAAIGVYAALRVGGYHPLGNPNYSRWMSTTPWHKGVGLPLGPSHLVWEDFVAVGVAGVGVWLAGNDWFIPIVVFAAGYTLSLICAAPRWTPRLVEYFTGFGWAGVMLWWGRSWVVVALVAAIVVVSQIGLRIVLAQFPWNTKLDEERRREEASRAANVWQLGPQPPPARIPLIHGLLVPVMVGCWIYCLMVSAQARWTWEGDSSPLALLGVGILALGAIRWLAFRINVLPPISIWGRLWTGRWIIQGYDQILVVPIVLWLVGAAMLIVSVRANVWPPTATAVIAAVMLICATNFPPTRRRWFLTGHLRIVLRGYSNRQTRQRAEVAM
jgi:hypothetical protein